MQKTTRHILFFAQCITCMSVIYFLSLMLQVSLVLIIPLIIVSLFILWKLQPAQDNYPVGNRAKLWPAIILLCGCFLLTKNTLAITTKHGQYDALAMWNLFAKFLADRGNWQRMFLIDATHPDYPLCLPAFLGLWFRVLGHGSWVIVPFIFSFCITLAIPALIFIEHMAKNLLVAAVTLYFFSQDTFYITRGVSQYADTLLAFFFLCAFISLDHSAHDKKQVALSALFLGSCMWTKNEGLVLATLFLLFNLRSFFSRPNIKYTLAGLAVPVLALVIFKLSYAPANDMVSGVSKNTLALLFDKSRYLATWKSFKGNLGEHFHYLPAAFSLYFVVCMVRKKWPGRHMLLLIACILAYFMIYIITPRDLAWQLFTSQNRLMHQLVPALVYIIAAKLSEIRFSMFKKEPL